MNIENAKIAVKAARKRGLSWVVLTTLLNPLYIVDIEELAVTKLKENQLVYPDPVVGGYVIFETKEGR
jgi:hypothetical protein